MGWLIFLFVILPIVSLIVMYIHYYFSSSEEKPMPDDMKGDSVHIGASVSRTLYDKIDHYCGKHHLTIAELIRKAVQRYIDE